MVSKSPVMLAQVLMSIVAGGFKTGVLAPPEPPSLELLQPGNSPSTPNTPTQKEQKNTPFTRMPGAYVNFHETSPAAAN